VQPRDPCPGLQGSKLSRPGKHLLDFYLLHLLPQVMTISQRPYGCQSSNRTPSNRTCPQNDGFLRGRMRCHQDLLHAVLINDKSSKRRVCLDPEDARFVDCQLNIGKRGKVSSKFCVLHTHRHSLLPYAAARHCVWPLSLPSAYCRYSLLLKGLEEGSPEVYRLGVYQRTAHTIYKWH
jgi:hypothetical protein